MEVATMLRIQVVGWAVLLAAIVGYTGAVSSAAQPSKSSAAPKASATAKASAFFTRTYELNIADNATSESFPGVPNFLGHVYVRGVDTPVAAVYVISADKDAGFTTPGKGFVEKEGSNGIEGMTMDDQGRRGKNWQFVNVPAQISKLRVTIAGIQE